MKLIDNISYGYHFMDRGQHTVTNCLSGMRTHSDNNSKLFNKLYHLNSSLYEVDLATTQIEQKELIF